jgi:hypothetical protein
VAALTRKRCNEDQQAPSLHSRRDSVLDFFIPASWKFNRNGVVLREAGPVLRHRPINQPVEEAKTTSAIKPSVGFGS